MKPAVLTSSIVALGLGVLGTAGFPIDRAGAQTRASSPGACVPLALTGTPQVEAASVSPLDRRISLRVVELSLPEAIDRLAGVADIRLSYSRELLPAGSVACVHATSVTVGELLAHLLRGSDLEPVAT